MTVLYCASQLYYSVLVSVGSAYVPRMGLDIDQRLNHLDLTTTNGGMVVHIRLGREHPPSTQRLSRLELIGAQIARRRVVGMAFRLGLVSVYRRFTGGLQAVWLRFASRSHTAYCAMSTSPRTT